MRIKWFPLCTFGLLWLVGLSLAACIQPVAAPLAATPAPTTATTAMTTTNALTTTTAVTSGMTSSQTTQLPPPPGQLVDIGGYRLHLYCIGTGKPTVILDAGLGDWSLIMRDLQQKVAGFTHVCAYDRAGYGWSDAGPQPRTTQQIVTELKTLLEKANVPGPYVLVGHSVAGFHLRVFAHEYPKLVAGMVWIDTTPPDFASTLLKRMPSSQQMFEGNHAQAVELRKKAHAGQLQLAESDEQSVASLLPQAEHRAIAALNLQPKYWDAYLGEIDGEANPPSSTPSEKQVQQITTLGNLPLILLEHTKLQSPDERPILDVLRALHKVQATLSTQMEVIMVDSTHYIYLEQPDVVIAAIQQMVGVVNGTQTLSTTVITATNTLTTSAGITQTGSVTSTNPISH